MSRIKNSSSTTRMANSYGVFAFDTTRPTGMEQVHGLLLRTVPPARDTAIITQGTILEAVLHIPHQGIFFSRAGVKKKLEKAVTRGWISQEDCYALQELWDHRCNVHLKLLGSHEFRKYTPEHVNQPRGALDRLMNKLRFLGFDGRATKG